MDLPPQFVIKARYAQAYLDAGSPTGKFWYLDQHHLLSNIADVLDIPMSLLAKVVAVTSPAVKWPDNIPNALKIFNGIEDGKDMNEVWKTISGYNTNKVKAALMILTEWEGFIRGPKVVAFAENLINPFSRIATIDRHMIRLALFDFTMSDDDLSKYSKANMIEYFAAPLRELADDLGLYVNELQAYLWVQSQQISEIVRKALGLRVYTVKSNYSY